MERIDEMMAEQGRLKKRQALKIRRRQEVGEAPVVTGIALPPIFLYPLASISQRGGRT